MIKKQDLVSNLSSTSTVKSKIFGEVEIGDEATQTTQKNTTNLIFREKRFLQ